MASPHVTTGIENCSLGRSCAVQDLHQPGGQIVEFQIVGTFNEQKLVHNHAGKGPSD